MRNVVCAVPATVLLLLSGASWATQAPAAPPSAPAPATQEQEAPPAAPETAPPASAPAVQSTVPPPVPPAPPPEVEFTWAKGLQIRDHADRFELNVRFRTQNRVTFESRSADDLALENVEAVPRRLRLRLEGFAGDPRLLYKIQLSFARGDQDWDNTGVPNVVRDAVVIWQQTKGLQFLFGQTKLPGNRQRVVSSGDLQFVDRSIVNATYNIDRDTGAQVHVSQGLWGMVFNLRGAITYGEGRNGGVAPAGNRGVAYTGRAEFLPFGAFTNGGDYFEGDLMREQTPKLSIGATYSTNRDSNRTGGTLGRNLYEPRTINTTFVDFIAKYRGLALYGEYALRTTPKSPVTSLMEGERLLERFVPTGTGWLAQGSYFFADHWELGARYALVKPASAVRRLTNEVAETTGVATYYLQGHKVKFQADVTHHDETALDPGRTAQDRWVGRFQIELGI